MQKTSILSLSAIALMGLSAVAYAASGNWTWYSADYKTSRPAGLIPNGDCLEMMCENGCVENEEYEGWCCPNDGNTGDSCTVTEGINPDACCQSGVCDKGKCGCKKDENCEGEQVCLPTKTCGCPSNTSKYIKSDGTTGCCVNSTHVLAEIAGSTNKACCPKETPFWDGSRCVECIIDPDCEGEQVCLPDKTCGCPSDTSKYTKSDGTTGCCVNSTHVLAEITGSTNKVCCPIATPHWNGNKCVACPNSETAPTSGCYDTLIHPTTADCPSYTTYKIRKCVTTWITGPNIHRYKKKYCHRGCHRSDTGPNSVYVGSEYAGKELYFTGRVSSQSYVLKINGTTLEWRNHDKTYVGVVPSNGTVSVLLQLFNSYGNNHGLIDGTLYIKTEQ